MLVVTVELWPQGDERKKEVLGVAKIHNDLTGDAEVGNYGVRLSQKGKPDHVWRTTSLHGFRRARGYWALVADALAKTLAAS